MSVVVAPYSLKDTKNDDEQTRVLDVIGLKRLNEDEKAE